MIDYDSILTELIKVARLPTYSPPLATNNGFPAVYRTRNTDTSKLEYPFILVDVLSTVDEDGWIINRYVDENDNVVYETNKQVLISFAVYGGGTNYGAQAIANQLKGSFRFDSVRNTIEENLDGVQVLEEFDVTSFPVQDSADKWIESASFNILLGVVDTSVDTSSGIVEDFTLDGELYRDPEDPDPLPVDPISIDFNP